MREQQVSEGNVILYWSGYHSVNLLVKNDHVHNLHLNDYWIIINNWNGLSQDGGQMWHLHIQYIYIKLTVQQITQHSTLLMSAEYMNLLCWADADHESLFIRLRERCRFLQYKLKHTHKEQVRHFIHNRSLRRHQETFTLIFIFNWKADPRWGHTKILLAFLSSLGGNVV